MRCTRPVEYAADGRRECRTCGAPLVGVGAELRHLGEDVPRLAPDPADALAFRLAREAAEVALRGIPRGASEADIAEAVLQGIARYGLLRRRPGPRRYVTPEREPDHAERAAHDLVAAS